MNVAAITRAFWKLTRVARAARFWLLVAVAALAWLGLGDASAQSHPIPVQCGSAAAGCTIEQAWAECGPWPQADLDVAHPADWVIKEACNEPNPTPTPGGTLRARTGSSTASDGHTQSFVYVSDCPPPSVWNDVTKLCDYPPECSIDDPPLGPGHVPYENSNVSLACQDECEYVDPDTSTDCHQIDGTFWCSVDGWLPTGNNCTAGGSSPGLGTPPGDADGDGASDGNDGAPNNPGDTGGDDPNDGDSEDGDEDGSETCGGPGQPVCDGTNGGSGNGNTSGGGGNCGSPPHSSGDAILAQIAYQTWATRCAVEGQGNGGSGGGDGDAISIEDGGTIEDMETPWVDGEGIEPSEWDSGLGGGSCPAPLSETITIAGHSATIEFSFDPLCQFATIMQAIVITMSLLLSAYIIAGVRV